MVHPELRRPVPATVVRSAALLSALFAVARGAMAAALSPAEELAGFHLADPALRVELVAAEPDVTSPVAMAWDADGRLYVAEMNDYPIARDGGRIRRLEDRDGDGRFESSVIFAESLHFPASVLPWRDGVLVAAAPDIVLLRDTDGDGRADERRVILSGFGEGNQQLRVNSLTWGLDNWIYGANGRSDGELRGPALSAPLSLRRRDFRFRPDTGVAEALAGASQFGLGFNERGDRFLSWNTVPIRHEILPQRYLDHAPAILGTESLHDCLDPDDDKRVYPLAPPPQTFNRESVTHFNALAGLHLYGGDALGPAYAGSAFVGETLRSLIHRRVLEPRGATFDARRAPNEATREFLAATDPWCHPVSFATGPDGALYFCDFYRRWVEHPGFVPAALRDKVDWREGWEHGRIWRIRSTVAAITNGPTRPPTSRATAADLVARLAHPNAWQRLTGQRLLVERQGHAAVAPLRDLAHRREPATALGRLHALHTLDGLGALEPADLLTALRDADARVRLAALRLSGPRLAAAPGFETRATRVAREGLASAVAKLRRDPDAAVRYEVALSARWLSPNSRDRALTAVLEHDLPDPWLARAALSSCADDARPLLRRFLAEPSGNRDPGFLLELGRLIGAQSHSAGTTKALDTVLSVLARQPAEVSVPTAAGLAEGLTRSGGDPRLVLGNAAGHRVLTDARAALENATAPVTLRLRALSLLAAGEVADNPDRLRPYLQAVHPPELQNAAAEALAASARSEDAARLLRDSGNFAAATRRHLLAAIARHPALAGPLVDALERQIVPAVELDPASRGLLLRHTDVAIRTRSTAALGGNASPDRAAVIERYQPALRLKGDFRRGATVFARNCQVCHRIGRTGGQVGPDLSGIGSRAPEILLTDILDPSRQLVPDFVAYTVSLRDHEALTGLLVNESDTAVTLRRPSLADETLPRSRIESIRAEGRSLMPDGLEAGISLGDFADLLAFLAAPDAAALPATP